MLTSTLDKIRDVICHAEIFNKNVQWHICEPALSECDLSLRDRDPVAFVRWIFVHGDSAKAVGFKMWRNHSREACDALLADEAVIKIILERKNRLAMWSSRQLAISTGVWNISRGNERARPIDAQIAFEAGDFERYVAHIDDGFTYYRTHARGRVVDLTYEELIRSGPRQVCEAIGVEPPDDLKPEKVRVSPPDILSRFHPNSREDVMEWLAANDRLEWAELAKVQE